MLLQIGGASVAGSSPSTTTWWTAERKEELWRRWKAGESAADIARALNKKSGSIHIVLRRTGGIAPLFSASPEAVAGTRNPQLGHRSRGCCCHGFFSPS